MEPETMCPGCRREYEAWQARLDAIASRNASTTPAMRRLANEAEAQSTVDVRVRVQIEHNVIRLGTEHEYDMEGTSIQGGHALDPDPRKWPTQAAKLVEHYGMMLRRRWHLAAAL